MRKSIHTSEQKHLLALLRELRQKAGLTQTQLAKLLHTDQTVVSKYETGERRLDILELREICRALGLSLSDFVSQLEHQLKGK